MWVTNFSSLGSASALTLEPAIVSSSLLPDGERHGGKYLRSCSSIELRSRAGMWRRWTVGMS